MTKYYFNFNFFDQKMDFEDFIYYLDSLDINYTREATPCGMIITTDKDVKFYKRYEIGG